jgi:hypothetical protein
MTAVIVVYTYLCLISFLIGIYIGIKGFPPHIQEYRSPFLLLVAIMNVPLAPLILWIQKGYGFKASTAHIGGAGITLICGFLFGSWLDTHSRKKNGTYTWKSSRFNRCRLKVSAAMIAGVWGAVIGNTFPFITIKVFLKDNYASTVTVLAVIAGWFISGFMINLLTRVVENAHTNKYRTLYSCTVNIITVIGLIHLGFLLFQDRGGFIFQKIALGLVGTPAIVSAVLTGIDGSR